jgi:hypothetical protein
MRHTNLKTIGVPSGIRMYFRRIIEGLDSVARLIPQLVHSSRCGQLAFLVLCHYRCLGCAQSVEGLWILTLDEQPLCSVKESRHLAQPCQSHPCCACAVTNEWTLLHRSNKQSGGNTNHRSSPRPVG